LAVNNPSENPILDREDLEHAVYQQAKKLVIALTLHAEATGDWGPSGPEFGRQSVTRWLCGLTPSQACYPERTDYLAQLAKAAQSYYFPWWPTTLNQGTQDKNILSYLEKWISEFTFQIGDQSFPLQEGEALDRLLADKGSDMILISGYHGTERNLILGRGTREEKAPYIHISLHSEYLRSPSIVMPIVAMIGVHSIVVRELAVETVFHDKWMPMLHSGWHITQPEKVGFAIKQKTLKNYGLTEFSENAILNIYPEFLSDMQLLLTAHEVGHGIIQHDLLPENTALMAESSQLLGESILIALLELLADIAPESAYGKGPLLEIVDRIHSAPKQAQRGFTLYLSDAYFYDTNTPHMFSYSHLILPVMAHLQQANIQPGKWLPTEVAMSNLDDIATWAMDWVKTLTDTLYALFEVQILDSDDVDSLKRYIQKGSSLYDALMIKTEADPTLSDKARDYLEQEAPRVYKSLYTRLGYTQIDPKNPTDGIVNLLANLV
jgi:hypothetical protein